MQYELVDIIKLIGSIMIFTMHGKAFGDNKYLLLAFELMTRWAVPFFFTISSYFLEKRIQENPDSRKVEVKKYCIRVFRLYLVWMLINIPSIIDSRLIGKDISSWNTWAVFFKNSIISSTFKGSWYLTSSIFSAWFVYWILRKCSIKKIIIATLPFEVLCIITSIYSGLLSDRLRMLLCDDFCFPLNIWGGGIPLCNWKEFIWLQLKYQFEKVHNYITDILFTVRLRSINC